jgi:hypothetical protein
MEKFVVHVSGVFYVKQLSKDVMIQMTTKYLVFKVNLYFICMVRY